MSPKRPKNSKTYVSGPLVPVLSGPLVPFGPEFQIYPKHYQKQTETLSGSVIENRF